MSLIKYIERLKRMDDLIRRRATGNSQEFANKMEVSTSQLFQDLKEMKELGAPIEYCTKRKAYCYKKDCRLILDFKESTHLKGGNGCFSEFEDSSTTGVLNVTFNTAGFLRL
jgi:hypothetical protein